MTRRSRKRDSANLSNRRRRHARKGKTAREVEAAVAMKKGLVMGGVALLLVGVFAAYGLTRKTIELDNVNCPIGLPLAGHTVFLIDGTDKVDGDYTDRFRSALTFQRDNLPIGQKLTIMRLSGNTDGSPEFKTVFSQCNPGQGSQFAGINESKKKKQAEWKTFFNEPLENALTDLRSLNVGDSSPILESLARLTFRPDYGLEIPNKRLVIISDMMHHTSDLSHYSNGYNYQSYADLGEPYSNVSLDGVKVEVIYIKRPSLKAFQVKRHRDFWNSYFENNKASIVSFR